MGRFVLLVIALFILIGLVRGALKFGRRRAPGARPADAVSELVRCAHCGVHVPRGEAQLADGLSYCSEAHRRQGARD
jgi:uncharacterized protein